MNYPVSVVSCCDYSTENINSALNLVIEQINGFEMIKPGMTVAIKANMVSGVSPEKAVVTHPKLIRRLCILLIERGCDVIVGDSPGGIYSHIYVNNIYKSSGMNIIEDVGAKLNDDFSISSGSFIGAYSLKTFSYTGWLDKADVIINFCKLKTHAMMGMSCSVKNLFGTIPGITKPEYHMRFPDEGDFANMLVDLNEYFHPVLNIVDAIDGMEGNGPTQGTPKHIGAILASRSPYNLDMVCAALIGLDRASVRTIEESIKRGLSPKNISDIKIIGEDYKSFIVPDFDTSATHQSIEFGYSKGFGRFVPSFLKIIFSTRPEPDKKECIGCKKCANICPANAITIEAHLPIIDRNKCIHCFCCQEFCPKGAMKVHRTTIGRIAHKINLH